MDIEGYRGAFGGAESEGRGVCWVRGTGGVRMNIVVRRLNTMGRGIVDNARESANLVF